MDKLLLCVVSRGQRGNKQQCGREGGFCACMSWFVVLNELNAVISLILEGNPKEALCFLTCVCEVAVLKLIFFQQRNVLMYVCD